MMKGGKGLSLVAAGIWVLLSITGSPMASAFQDSVVHKQFKRTTGARYLYIDQSEDEIPSITPRGKILPRILVNRAPFKSSEKPQKQREVVESQTTMNSAGLQKVGDIVDPFTPERDVPQLLRENNEVEIIGYMISNIGQSFADGLKAAFVAANILLGKSSSKSPEDANGSIVLDDPSLKTTRVLNIVTQTAAKSAKQTVSAFAALTALAVRIGDRARVYLGGKVTTEVRKKTEAEKARLVDMGKTMLPSMLQTKSVIPKPPKSDPPMHLLFEDVANQNRRVRRFKPLSLV